MIGSNEKREGGGRSVNLPRNKLKIQIFLTVVTLLNLDCKRKHIQGRPHARRITQATPPGWVATLPLDSMVTKENVLAIGEVGFVSLESSTPRKPGGTFIPKVETLPRSPRLAAKRERCRVDNTSNSESRTVGLEASGLPTPMRKAVRKTAEA
jgi:hypothetical protein